MASLGLVSPGTAADGVALFSLQKKLFSHRPLESDDLFSCRRLTTSGVTGGEADRPG